MGPRTALSARARRERRGRGRKSKNLMKNPPIIRRQSMGIQEQALL